MTRRTLLKTAGLTALVPAWARSAGKTATTELSTLTGTEFDLVIEHLPILVDGRTSHSIAINGHVPGPLLRWKEGDDITIRVTNHVHDHHTSIHWHGVLLPFQMDGVPGVSFPGIKPGETFTYKFKVKQSGTYWYHSHSGMQEQMGHYGSIIIAPKNPDPVVFDREHVVVLSDWTFRDPHRLLSRLKKVSDNFNFQKRTVGTFIRDSARQGFGTTLKDRAMWGTMRMDATDLADVTGAAYTYLVNGRAPADNWTALFEPGERVRLRIINASAMTIFNIRIPGLPMTVVQCDGQNVEPVEIDEFQMGIAETYDVIVQPKTADAFTLMCETIDRSGYARATLAPREGMQAKVPALRPRPTLTMKDMGHGGMDHGAMNHPGMNHGEMKQGEMQHGETKQGDTQHGAMNHTGMDHGKANPKPTDHSRMNHESHNPQPPAATDHSQHQQHPPPSSSPEDHSAHQAPAAEHGAHQTSAGGAPQQHNHPGGPGNSMVASHPVNRLNEPGTGLNDVSHRTLRYTQLKSIDPNPDTREPGREIELHLTSNMERYMWSFDGKKYSDNVDPILFYKDERVRLTMVNDTMMAHPIHLHGMFFDVVTGAGHNKPRKHTILVKPGEKMSIDVTADAPGDWAFHCHLLYHMHAGMFQVVSVVDAKTGAHS